MKAIKKSGAEMEIKRTDVVEHLIKYTNHEMSLNELVDWAENAMMEGSFEADYHDAIRDIISRLGLADVKEFGLSWDDIYDYFSRLCYKIEVKAVQSFC